MDENEPRYWFPAKRYGWGWGPPSTWEGWLVLGVWFALAVLDAWFLIPYSQAVFLALLVVLTAALVAVCYKKGEPAGWRRR